MTAPIAECLENARQCKSPPKRPPLSPLRIAGLYFAVGRNSSGSSATLRAMRRASWRVSNPAADV
jgi:hypothetical protein